MLPGVVFVQDDHGLVLLMRTRDSCAKREHLPGYGVTSNGHREALIQRFEEALGALLDSE
jgi:hypothetical protein